MTAMLVLNSTIGSALPSMAVPFITEEFHITSSSQKVLPISVFLIGYVFGPLIWGPLSEQYGRRNLTFVTFTAFTLFTMACALAPNWPALLIFRFFCGVFASSPIAIVAGILADIYDEPRTRGKAFAIFMVVSLLPVSHPNLHPYTHTRTQKHPTPQLKEPTLTKQPHRQQPAAPSAPPSSPASPPPQSAGAGPSGSASSTPAQPSCS